MSETGLGSHADGRLGKGGALETPTWIRIVLTRLDEPDAPHGIRQPDYHDAPATIA